MSNHLDTAVIKYSYAWLPHLSLCFIVRPTLLYSHHTVIFFLLLILFRQIILLVDSERAKQKLVPTQYGICQHFNTGTSFRIVQNKPVKLLTTSMFSLHDGLRRGLVPEYTIGSGKRTLDKNRSSVRRRMKEKKCSRAKSNRK